MKLSTIYRRAARTVAQPHNSTRFCCCPAIRRELAGPPSLHSWSLALATFRVLFRPEAVPADDPWWDGPVTRSDLDHEASAAFDRAQNARVIALLLAAEIASDEERAARKTSRNLKSKTP